MKMRELRAKTPGELKKLLDETRQALRKLRFSMAKGEVKNVREYARTKREIARILTILNESLHGKRKKS